MSKQKHDPAGSVSLNSRLSAEQQKYMEPNLIRSILQETNTIAMVGLSPKSERPSHFVATYLQYEGFQIIPINPRADEILGVKAYPDLKSAARDHEIDLVNVFRRPEDCPAIAQDAVEVGAKSLWLQLRVISQEAADIAETAGLNVVMDRCVKIEHGRYNGSLHWVGMNTEIISARRGRKYLG